MYEVIILKEGYSKPAKKGTIHAGGTITLLKGPKNVLVDTGSPWDKELLLNELTVRGLKSSDIKFAVCTSGVADKVGNLNLFPEAMHIVSNRVCQSGSFFLHAFQEVLLHIPECCLQANYISPETVDYVICSHGHSDHIGNLNLFGSSIHIVSFDVCHRDQYLLHEFKEGIPYEIDEHLEIWPTPGHTGADVSVIVRGTKHGTVAITGDLFESFEDLEDPDLWQASSERPAMQEQSRIDVLRVADYIVPGHGPMFKVPLEYHKHMRVVMMREDWISESDGLVTSSSSKTECVIVETD